MMDDDTFYRTYYGGTTIPRHVPIHIRAMLIRETGSRWLSVRPEDQIVEDDEIDFGEVILQLADELGVRVPHEDIMQMGATFDEVVRYFAERIDQRADRCHKV